LYYMAGDYQASLNDIEETLKLEPRHFGALSGRGMCYIKLDNWLLAISAFKKALDVNPWLVEAQHNIDLLKRLLKQVAFNGISTKVINI
jgi:tetratricopeptide (TPR) repeat protein